MHAGLTERPLQNHGLVHPILIEAYHFHNYANELLAEVQSGPIDDIALLGLKDLEPLTAAGDKWQEQETTPQGGGDEDDELDYLMEEGFDVLP